MINGMHPRNISRNHYIVVFVNNHEKRLKELDTLSSQLGKKVENLTKEDEKLKEIIEGNSKKVAFTAGTHAPRTTASGHTLVFPVVINNEGGGYDPSSGVFTAPRDGQYVFFVSAQGYSSDTLYVSIVHNGGPKVMTMSDGGRKKDFYDSGSNLVALNLKMDDRVWAQCQSGSHYHSEGIAITTFSGFLV
uniref:Complement C1q-like protein 4 isoform X3 n=1 Tax=Crassostrea virginica TaxID=6565 RepID=A0A8B8AMI6_CRAVI|nr:complement C1q-like protein 4 isoform X3 [Crassostrea virginica]